MRSFDTDGTDVSGVFDTDRNCHIYIKKYQIPISSHEPSGTLGELIVCEKEISICTEVISYNAVNVNNHDYFFNTIVVKSLFRQKNVQCRGNAFVFIAVHILQI